MMEFSRVGKWGGSGRIWKKKTTIRKNIVKYTLKLNFN